MPVCYFCHSSSVDLTIEFNEDLLALCAACANELYETLTHIYAGN